MIKKDNFAKVLAYLGFEMHGDVYSKHYVSTEDSNSGFELKTNIKTGEFFYPDGVEADRGTTQDDHQNESYVGFACVAQLFALGYKPNHFKLEGKNYSGTNKGFIDILVKDNNGDEFLIIECKTENLDSEKEDEFRKHWEKTKTNGDQLFRYFNTYRKTKYLCLFSCDWINERLENTYHVISLNDNEEYLKSNKKLRGFDAVRAEQGGHEEYFNVWKNTYKQDYTTRGIFETGLAPFNIGTKKYNIEDLSEIDQYSMQKKYNKFAEILRQHNVSSKENAFDKLVNLFLSKIVDETENQQELKCLWKGTATDNFFDLHDRLQDLYRKGMNVFFGDTVTYVANEQIENAFKFLNDQASFAKDEIKKLLFDLKYFNNNPFAFLDVHNEDLFYKNAVILIEVVKMLQDIKLKTEKQNQFLGDLFEGFLDQGIKQSEGQFFTPMPIVRFLISSLPLEQIIQKGIPQTIDYACGAGHFLTEFASQIKPLILDKHRGEIEKYKDEVQRNKYICDLTKQFNERIVGIEKEYRLSKVSQVSAFMYGQDGVNIIYADALSHIDKIKNGTFDVLVANPPYSVKGFLETLTDDEKAEFDLFDTVSDLSTNKAIEAFFVERAKQLLRTDGIAAIILPTSVLDKGGIYTKCRELILKHFDIIAIFESGSGTFGKTGTKTATLFLQRRACDKDGDTDIVKHYTNRVDTWFSGCFDNDTYYDDYMLFEQYCARIGVEIDDYKVLFDYSTQGFIYDITSDNVPMAEYGKKKNWRDVLSEYDIFSLYISSFENDKEAKKIKDDIKETGDKSLKGKYTKEKKDAELLALNEKFEQHVLGSIIKVEKEKLLFFLLANSNKQKVVVIRTPNITKNNDTSGQQKFLGYKWSNAKGNEGIKYLNVKTKSEEDDDTLQQLKGIDDIQTPLFNPKDLYDPEKINTLIRQNYIDGNVIIPSSLKEYVALFSLVDMIDFEDVKFEKDIKRIARKKIEIVTTHSLVPFKSSSAAITVDSGSRPSGGVGMISAGALSIGGEHIGNSNGYLNLDNPKYVPSAFYKLASKGKLRKNDLLICKDGALTGKVAIVRDELAGKEAMVNEHVFLVRCQNDITQWYLFAFLYSQIGQMLLQANITGAAQGGLNRTKLNAMKVPIPPIDVQKQVVSEYKKIDNAYNTSRMSDEVYRKRITEIFKRLKVIK